MGDNPVVMTSSPEPTRVLLRMIDGWISCCPRSGFHRMTATTAAPPSLVVMDDIVWRQFRRHVFLNESHDSTESSKLVGLCLSAFILLYYAPHLFDGDLITMICYIMFTICSFCLISHWQRLVYQRHEKLLRKMKPTIEAQGFSVELVHAPSLLCFLHLRWIEFSPNGRSPVSPTTLSLMEEQRNQPYVASDWAPLEGTWTRTQHVNDGGTFWGRIFSTSSVGTVVRGTQTEADFSFQQLIHGRGGSALCRSETLSSSRSLQGNVLSFETSSSDSSDLKKMLLSSVYDGMVPLGRSESIMYYRIGPTGVCCIDTKAWTWKEYVFDYMEDVPEDNVILAGGLHHVTVSTFKTAVEGLSIYSVFERVQAPFVDSGAATDTLPSIV